MCTKDDTVMRCQSLPDMRYFARWSNTFIWFHLVALVATNIGLHVPALPRKDRDNFDLEGRKGSSCEGCEAGEGGSLAACLPRAMQGKFVLELRKALIS